MLHDGYKSKYEKTISNDEYTKSVCIYEVEDGYVVKIKKCPKDENGMENYEKEEVKYYISSEDPTHLIESEKKEKDYGSDGSSGAAEAIKNMF